MRRNLNTFLILMTVLLLFSPVKTMAVSYDNSNVVYQMQSSVNSTSDVSGYMNDYNQTQSCTGGNSLLGDPGDPNSVAWLLQQVLNYIKILGPILVVVLSSVDFLKVIISGNDDAMAKAQKKLVTRLILAALLFFIPNLVTILLDLFGLTSESTCGIS